MIGKNHKIMGAAVWLNVLPLICKVPMAAVISLLFTPIAVYASLVPDIDHPKSSAGKRFPKISKFVSKQFGHRGFTHSLILSLLLAWPFFMLRFNVNVLLILPVLAFNVGYVSHIIADWHTVRGVKLLWPMNIVFRLPLFSFKTGSKFEIVACLIWVILGLQCIASICYGFEPWYMAIFHRLCNVDAIHHAVINLHHSYDKIVNNFTSNNGF